MNWLIKRLQEPSTGAGIALLSQVARMNPAWAQYAPLFDALTAVGATHAVVMPETKSGQ